MNSWCAEVSPLDGSLYVLKIGSVSGSLNQATWFMSVNESGPACVALHRAISLGKTSAVRWSWNVSFEFTDQLFGTKGWSCRFLPTDVRFRMGLIPSLLSSSWSPMPESMSSWGVLKTPAERMISFLAVTMLLAADGTICQ